MAKGIDSYSHIGCINAGGKTIAILGSGLDQMYPKENVGLYNKIIQTGGLILSEYVIGTKATKLNFPARNRIISGISKGIIVVEAKQKSGTLNTVDFALDQGKDVYVIPRKHNKPKFTRNQWINKTRRKMRNMYRWYINVGAGLVCALFTQLCIWEDTRPAPTLNCTIPLKFS